MTKFSALALAVFQHKSREENYWNMLVRQTSKQWAYRGHKGTLFDCLGYRSAQLQLLITSVKLGMKLQYTFFQQMCFLQNFAKKEIFSQKYWNEKKYFGLF